MGYVQLIFQILIIASAVVVGLKIKSKSSQRNNEIEILKWFESMDAVSHKQRWRGERSQIIDVTSMTKIFTGMDVQMLCVTRSSRWFTVKAQSRWCQITKWSIEPIDVASVALDRGISEDEVIEIAKSIEWRDAASGNSALKNKKSVQAGQTSSP